MNFQACLPDCWTERGGGVSALSLPIPFALSLSKGCLSPLPWRRRRAGLRQAQPERFWGSMGILAVVIVERAADVVRLLGHNMPPEGLCEAAE